MAAAFTRTARRWLAEEKAAALPEFALLFPVLIAMIMGTYDVGRALTINQKVISASQIIADLITRNQSIDAQGLEDIILAGKMALDPYDRTPIGYDIVSLQYDEDGDPEELWRVTDNMLPSDVAIDRAENLGEDGDGVVAVTISYVYEPYFTDFIQDEVAMQEIAIMRGRRSSTVSCGDC